MFDRPMFMWGWAAVTLAGEVAMTTQPLTDKEIVTWKDTYRSYAYWSGRVPQC